MSENRKSVLAKVGPILALFLMWHSPIALSQSSDEVIVRSPAANIRSGPSTNNAPLLMAEQGMRFSVVRRVGGWYEIEIPRSAGVSAPRGFIHQSTVDMVSVPRIGPEVSSSYEVRPSREEPLPPEDYGPSREVDAFELQRRWTDQQWREYERYKKSEFAAAALEWIIPLLGYAYVDEAKDGLTPALVSLGGLTTSFVGVYVGDTGNAPLVFGGLAAYVGGRIWGIVNALEYADGYNRELIRRVSTVMEESDVVIGRTSEGKLMIGVNIAR